MGAAPSAGSNAFSGRGSVFEVSTLCDAGRQLIVKRPAVRGSRLATQAIEREREILARAEGSCLPRLVEADAQGSCLPRLVGSGTDQHGAFLVETKAPGEPLRAWAEAKRPLPNDRWHAVATALLGALVDLHGLRDGTGPLRIVHGDISPDNLFFEPPGRVTFVDLSASVWRGGAEPVFPNARGTLPYSAPEIVRGECVPDAATDVYALSAVLLWLTTDRIAKSSDEPALLLEIGTRGLALDAMPDRCSLPVPWREAILAALAFERGARLTSAAHVLACLAP